MNYANKTQSQNVLNSNWHLKFKKVKKLKLKKALNKKDISLIKDCFDSQEPSRRREVALILVHFVEKSTLIRPIIVKALFDESHIVRLASHKAFKKLAKTSNKEISLIIKKLPKTRNIVLKKDLIIALSLVGKKAIKAVPYLIKVYLRGKESFVRYYAFDAIREIDSKGRVSLPIISKLINKKSVTTKIRISYILTAFKNSKKAIYLLEKFLKDPNSSVRHSAVSSLLDIQNNKELIVDSIKNTLDDKSPEVRAIAICLAAKMEKKADILTDKIIEKLNDSDVFVRREAYYFIGNLKQKQHVIIPKLIKGLDSKDINIVYNSLSSIRTIGKKAHKAMPKLIKILQEEKETYIVQRAIEVLFVMGEYSIKAVPTLVKLRNNQNYSGSIKLLLDKIKENKLPNTIKLLYF